MCAIGGILNFQREPVSHTSLKAMGDVLAHRGPDGEGFFVDQCLGLMHRRLAIQDLSPAGHQPMQTQDGRYILSYNGEVYNFHQLRLELESRGVQFHSKTDSEVVLKTFAAFGVDGVLKFNGMFAFAIWDRQERALYLVRDRYGVKPLYYYLDDERLIFASEVKAILATGYYKPQVDKEALVEYLTFQNFFTDKTLFKEIRLLPAGNFLRIGMDKSAHQKTYWDFDFCDQETNEKELSEKVHELFAQSVSRQLISDVPVNSYLSGGIDSAAITLFAAQKMPHLRTFTIGFDLNSASGLELNFDERERAEYLSYLAGTEHYEMVLKAGDMERCLAQLVWHLEEPRIGQSYPNYYAAKLASKFGKVVLAGTGGDELFAGYPWRYYQAGQPNHFEDYIDQYYSYWQRLIAHDQLSQVCAPIYADVRYVCTRDIFKNVFKSWYDGGASQDYLNHSLYFEAKTFLHGLLMMEDKLSMAHSLETRVPFLDNDLVDLAMQIPARFNLGDYPSNFAVNENRLDKKHVLRSNNGKQLLRKVLKAYVPEKISTSKKQGFSSPDASWFKGESIEFVKNVLYADAAIYNYLDKRVVTTLVDQHLRGEKNQRLLIWSLLYLEQFLTTFIDTPVVKRDVAEIIHCSA